MTELQAVQSKTQTDLDGVLAAVSPHSSMLDDLVSSNNTTKDTIDSLQSELASLRETLATAGADNKALLLRLAEQDAKLEAHREAADRHVREQAAKVETLRADLLAGLQETKEAFNTHNAERQREHTEVSATTSGGEKTLITLDQVVDGLRSELQTALDDKLAAAIKDSSATLESHIADVSMASTELNTSLQKKFVDADAFAKNLHAELATLRAEAVDTSSEVAARLELAAKVDKIRADLDVVRETMEAQASTITQNKEVQQREKAEVSITALRKRRETD